MFSRGMTENRFAVVVLAAGQGLRMKAQRNKVYLPLAGHAMLAWSLKSFSTIAEVARIIVVVRPEERILASRVIQSELPDVMVELVSGGDSRHESEYLALDYLASAIFENEIDYVLVHDGDRPCVEAPLVYRVIAAALKSRGAIPAIEIEGLHASDRLNISSENKQYVLAQTPQMFPARALLQAHWRARADSFVATDSSECVEKYHEVEIRWVAGDIRNIKITYPEDMLFAESILNSGLHPLT